MKLSDDLPCHFKATSHEGALWIFAQNMDMQKRTGTATFRVDGLKAGAKIEEVDEGRSLTAGDAVFTDQFEGLAEHVYRLAE